MLRKGFTLTEVLIVLSILGLLLGITLPAVVTVHGPVQRITPRRRDLRSAGAVTAQFLRRT
jgi:prepilin-type N-terminal cleavage/methylation domain-containing protein